MSENYDSQENYDPHDMRSLFTEYLRAQDSSFHLREEQIFLAEKINHTMGHGGNLLAEAGTGIGKSFSYLVPALLYANAGYKVIIVTATINLQHQLVDYDIPRMKRLLKLQVPVTVLKGKRNYLCKRRADLFFSQEQDLIFKTEGMKEIYDWTQNSNTGDKEELSKRLDIPQALWNDIATDEYACGGSICAKRRLEGCFYLEQRRKAREVGVVITNYSILAYHLRMQFSKNSSSKNSNSSSKSSDSKSSNADSKNSSSKSSDSKSSDSSDSSLLPEDAIYILDEAHRLPEIIRNGLVTTLSEQECKRVHDLFLGKKGFLTQERKQQGEFKDAALKAIDLYTTKFADVMEQFSSIQKTIQEWTLSESQKTKNKKQEKINYNTLLQDQETGNRLLDDFFVLSTNIEMLRQFLRELQGAFKDKQNLSSQIGNVHQWWEQQQYVALGLSQDETSSKELRWCEYGEGTKNVQFATVRLQVDDVLEEHFFNRVPVSICTSATMAVFQEFEYWKKRAGLRTTSEELLLPSPFLYKERVLMAIPKDAPMPTEGEEKYIEYLKSMLPKTIRATSGRCLVLCTSNSMVRALGEHLKKELVNEESRVLMQDGRYSSTSLGRKFREDVQSVLVATSSFWEGFDAPGETMRMLVITRIPFTSPEDFFFKEEAAIIEQNGENSFRNLSLPLAELRLRQGFGRLMRSSEDGGVVLITDKRIIEKSYGKILMRALPKCKECFDTTKNVQEEILQHIRHL